MDHSEEDGIWRAIGACEQAVVDAEDRIERIERGWPWRLVVAGCVGWMLGLAFALVFHAGKRAGQPQQPRPVMSVESGMSVERETGVPAFEVAGVTFRCFTQIEVEGTPMVWRSDCRRLTAGRLVRLRTEVDEDTGESVERVFSACWARLDGVLIGSEFSSLKVAMVMAASKIWDVRAAA